MDYWNRDRPRREEKISSAAERSAHGPWQTGNMTNRILLSACSLSRTAYCVPTPCGLTQLTVAGGAQTLSVPSFDPVRGALADMALPMSRVVARWGTDRPMPCVMATARFFAMRPPSASMRVSTTRLRDAPRLALSPRLPAQTVHPALPSQSRPMRSRARTWPAHRAIRTACGRLPVAWMWITMRSCPPRITGASAHPPAAPRSHAPHIDRLPGGRRSGPDFLRPFMPMCPMHGAGDMHTTSSDADRVPRNTVV